MNASPPEAFSQRFCSVSRVTAEAPGAEYPRTGFLIRVTCGTLYAIELPSVPILCVPTAEVRIVRPRWQRDAASGSILRISGQLWSVQFGPVYRAEAASASRHGVLRSVTGAVAPRRSARRGREINRRFTAALLGAGAAEEVPAVSPQARPTRRPG